jgi:hypothetical protein
VQRPGAAECDQRAVAGGVSDAPAERPADLLRRLVGQPAVELYASAEALLLGRAPCV